MLAPGTLLYSIFASIGAVGILEIPAATNQAIAGMSIKTGGAAKKDGSIAYIKKEQTQCLFRPRAYSTKQMLRIFERNIKKYQASSTGERRSQNQTSWFNPSAWCHRGVAEQTDAAGIIPAYAENTGFHENRTRNQSMAVMESISLIGIAT